jgi:hypothetical protein
VIGPLVLASAIGVQQSAGTIYVVGELTKAFYRAQKLIADR